MKRVERPLAFDLLSGDERRADKRRYRAFEKVPVAEYIEPGDEIEIHRSVLPWKFSYSWDGSPPHSWDEWTRVTLDRIGPDCVRVFLPLRGSHPVPVGVVRGHIREPLNTAG